MKARIQVCKWIKNSQLIDFKQLYLTFLHSFGPWASVLESWASTRPLCSLHCLLHQQQNFLNFAYANHMQFFYFYLRFFVLEFSRREDLCMACRLQLGHHFLHCPVLSHEYSKVIIKNQVKRSNGPFHVAIFNYQLINYANV